MPDRERGRHQFIAQGVGLLAFAAFAMVFLSGLLAIGQSDARLWVDLVSDDAYYYAGIARHLVMEGRSTFAPPLDTNGYQPLWMLLCWLSGALFGVSERGLVVQLYALSFAFSLAFIWYAQRLHGRAVAAVLALLTFPAVGLLGMETCMIPLLFLAFMQAPTWQSRGVLGSLLFLSRLDALSVVVARDALSLVIHRRRPDWRPYLIIVPVVLAYVAFNAWQFGLPVPVSGLSKAVGHQLGENWLAGAAYMRALMPLSWWLPVAAVALLAREQLASFECKHGEAIAVALLAALACASYYSLKSGWPVWPWYQWAAMLASYHLMAQGVDVMARMWRQDSMNVRKLLVMACVLGALIFTAWPASKVLRSRILLARHWHSHTVDEDGFESRNITLAAQIKAKLPAHALVAMGDRAGSLGYFLDASFRFFQTEGLVAGRDYFLAMKQDQGLAYLQSMGVDYLVTDRERYLEDGELIGVIEPVQGLSAHVGPYLMCFPRSAIVIAQPSSESQRFVFDFHRRQPCPANLQARFETLRAHYSGVRSFSLPSEHAWQASSTDARPTGR
jgi:hypothetical protein